MKSHQLALEAGAYYEFIIEHKKIETFLHKPTGSNMECLAVWEACVVVYTAIVACFCL